jgi:DNA (cytosine-5)-methyltransferase 1
VIEIIVPKTWKHVLDAMCGAGGSYAGTARALHERGFGVRAVAINHWSKAIATHQANHPDVVHFVEGIDDIDIERIVDEHLDGYVDYLCLSPECDAFSRAKGGKVSTDAQRCHAHFLVNAITKVPVRRCFVENVWEFTQWGPLCELEIGHTGKHGRQWPPARPAERCNKRLKGKDENGYPYEGSFFQAWLADISRAGWDFRFWPINAADYGAPTTRMRFIGMGCRDQGGVVFPTPTHCDPRKMPEPGLFGVPDLKPWRTAEEIIRKGRLGTSLMTSKSRRKDGAIRSPKTLLRLGRGALENWGAVGAVAVNALTERGLPVDSKIARDADAIVRALPVDELGLPVVDIEFVYSDAVVMSQHGGGVADKDNTPVPTITHGGAHTVTRALITPYYSATPKSSTDATPLDTVTAKDRFSIDRARLIPIISAQRENNVARSASEPVQTLTGIPAMLIVRPAVVPAVAVSQQVVITENFSERASQNPRYYTQDKPVASVTQRGAGDIARAALAAPDDQVSRKRLIRAVDGQIYSVDVYSRMFDVDELLDAQGCPAGYVVLGTKSQQKEQIGNMVCPPVAEACIGAQEDNDRKLLVLPDAPRTATPLPDGREPASVRNYRQRYTAASD